MKNQKARVVSEYRGGYKVKDLLSRKEFLAKVTGKKMFTAKNREDYPAVGDFVIIDELPENQAIIKSILERKSIIKRKYGNKNKVDQKGDIQVIATNIDVAFVVQSFGRDYNLNRIERYFSILSDDNIKATIILNKIDLISKEELNEKLNEIKDRFPNIDIILTSTTTNEGLNNLKKYLEKDKTYCFLGSSGVGKSSIINKLLSKNIIKTNDIILDSDRGKHTTTRRQMYFLENGATVIDNPGIREVGPADVNIDLEDLFNKINDLSLECKFTNCTHTQEIGCKVLEAVESQEINKEQYENYLNLKKESDFYKMSEIEKKEKERDFGKFINKAKKTFKKYNKKNNF